jgi:hypothetical protein
MVFSRHYTLEWRRMMNKMVPAVTNFASWSVFSAAASAATGCSRDDSLAMDKAGQIGDCFGPTFASGQSVS